MPSTISRHRGLRFLLLIMLALPMVTTTGCKNKKKLAEQQRIEAERRAREAQVANAKATLQALLDSPFSKSYDELRRKEQQLEEVKSLNLDDPEVKMLISEVETKLRQEREALDELERQKKVPPKPAASITSSGLNQLFADLANTRSTESANQKINAALQHFATANTPVLIVISNSGGTKDYDRPTTIGKYLNYLKDQQRNLNMVSDMKLNAQGKITELELTKR